jgi:hypothetical protein
LMLVLANLRGTMVYAAVWGGGGGDVLVWWLLVVLMITSICVITLFLALEYCVE